MKRTMSIIKQLRRYSLVAITSAFIASPAAYAERIALDGVAAIVNNDIILESEFTQRLALVTQRVQARGQLVPNPQVLRSQVMDRLVLDSLLKQLAERQGIRISDRQLNQAVESIASRNGMTVPQFRQALIAEGQNYEAAREQIRNEMLVTQVQQSNVNRRIRVSDQEIRNYLKQNSNTNQQVEVLLSIILAALPQEASPQAIQDAKTRIDEIATELSAGADFADVAIASSDAPNALNGGDMGWRRLNELPEPLAEAVADLNSGEISTPIRAPSGFYIAQVRDTRGGAVELVDQTKVRHILIKPSEIRSPAQAKRLIDRIYNRLQQGEPFDEIARELSDDKGSGSEGGALGWASPGQMVPEFEQVMTRSEPGQISEPFQSRFGWHILEVEDRRTKNMGDEMQESQAKAAISKRKFDEELANWLRELRSQAYVEIKN